MKTIKIRVWTDKTNVRCEQTTADEEMKQHDQKFFARFMGDREEAMINKQKLDAGQPIEPGQRLRVGNHGSHADHVRIHLSHKNQYQIEWSTDQEGLNFKVHIQRDPELLLVQEGVPNEITANEGIDNLFQNNGFPMPGSFGKPAVSGPIKDENDPALKQRYYKYKVTDDAGKIAFDPHIEGHPTNDGL